VALRVEAAAAKPVKSLGDLLELSPKGCRIFGNAPVPIYEMGSKMSWRPASEKIESINAPTPPRFVA
jgi:hypothetical protein